ncbi:MAG: GGDEF domain-containing protein [Thiotrichales bacterium]|nr:GGDEF domain-containing protein [Thiotrichales bacterium]
MMVKRAMIDAGELKLFRALWEHSEDTMFVVFKNQDGDFITEKSNPSLIKIAKLTPEQAFGCPLKTLMSAESYQLIADNYNACLNSDSSISYEEQHLIGDDKATRYWLTTLIPVTDPDSGEQRIFGTSREVTKLKRYEDALELTNSKLERLVEERTRELKHALSEMEKISQYDKLTNLFNRRKLDSELFSRIELAERYGEDFGLVLIDIDNFKTINDTLGHYIGDKALVEFSQILKQSVRSTDVLGRWGGDEFLIIAPKATKQETLALANKIKSTLVQQKSEAYAAMTSSIGVTQYQESDSLESIITRVDKEMYSSKFKGKNTISFA